MCVCVCVCVCVEDTTSESTVAGTAEIGGSQNIGVSERQRGHLIYNYETATNTQFLNFNCNV